jgi:hypothetical protein
MNEREKFKQEVMREVMAYVDNAASAWQAKSEPSFFDKIEPPQSSAMAWTTTSQFYNELDRLVMGDNRMGADHRPDPHVVYKEAKKERWKPEVGEKFWYIRESGVCCGEFTNNAFFAFGNCFPTKEEAKAARDKVKALLLSK